MVHKLVNNHVDLRCGLSKPHRIQRINRSDFLKIRAEHRYHKNNSFAHIYNAQGLYWNYFYHVWKLFSESPYSNAVVFTSNPDSVTSVTVSPDSANVAKGSTQQMTATVVTTGYASKAVNWSVTGAQTPTSRISNTGLLTVATNEPNDSLTVTAVSAYDPDKSDTSTITVTA